MRNPEAHLALLENLVFRNGESVIRSTGLLISLIAKTTDLDVLARIPEVITNLPTLPDGIDMTTRHYGIKLGTHGDLLNMIVLRRECSFEVDLAVIGTSETPEFGLDWILGQHIPVYRETAEFTPEQERRLLRGIAAHRNCTLMIHQNLLVLRGYQVDPLIAIANNTQSLRLLEGLSEESDVVVCRRIEVLHAETMQAPVPVEEVAVPQNDPPQQPLLTAFAMHNTGAPARQGEDALTATLAAVMPTTAAVVETQPPSRSPSPH
jgi:hypothetical protein